MNIAPIALFVYNRPKHTKQTVAALQNNKLSQDSNLFIFSDGPRKKEDEKKVKEVRNYIKSITGFKNIIIDEKEKNQGLADSIVNGVTKIINKYDKIIVLEDDIVTFPYFLEYMNDALEIYKNELRVMHIAGYFFPVKNNLPETFFFNQASCWGWATWKHAWKYFNNNAETLYQKIKEKKLIKKFNIDGSKPNLEQQLIDNINKNNKTWAIKWYANILLSNGLCLHPNKSLIRNIGFDGSGENCKNSNNIINNFYNKKIIVKKTELKENLNARKIAKNFYNKSSLKFSKNIEKFMTKSKNLKGPIILISKPIAFTFPFGYAYLAGYLMEKGEDVKILFRPENPNDYEKFVDEVINLNPLLVGLGTLYPDIYPVGDIIKIFKEKKCQFPLVIGGQMVTPLPEFVTQITGADYGVIGEGEIILHNLVTALRNEEDTKDIKGLIINNSGKIIKTGSGPFIQDMS